MDGPRGKHTGNTRQPEGPHKALRREASERLAGRCDSADTCATIRGSANGGHDTCFNVFITRFICGSWLTCRIDTSLAPALGWLTRLIHRDKSLLSTRRRVWLTVTRHVRDVAYVRRGALSLRLLVSRLPPREPRPETRESGETRRRLSPGHISVCNEQNRQPSMSSSLFLTHENTRVSICTAQNEVPCCPELMTTRQSERGVSRP
jgi:hypothetical protein